MKKKLLILAVMIAVVTSVFVISASAKTYGESEIYYFDCAVEELSGMTTDKAIFYSKRDANDIITEYSGAFAKTNGEGDAVSWYKTGDYDAGNGVIFVSVKSFVTMDTAYANVPGDGRYLFQENCEVRKSNVVSINFPNDSAIKSFSDGSAYSLYAQTGSYKPANSELLFAYFPNTWQETFRLVQATPVLEVYFDEGCVLDKIADVAFYDCRSLRKVVLPKTLKTIEGGSGAFFSCKNLTDINLCDTAVTTLGNQTFKDCDAFVEFTIPNTVTTVGDRILENCDSLEVLRFGANLGNLTQSIIYQSKNIKYIYISNTITTASGSHRLTSSDWEGAYQKSVIFFAGSEDEAMALKTLLTTSNASHEQKINHSNFIAWDSANSDEYYWNLANEGGKNYVVYGYNKCLAFYGGHAHDTNCTTDDACQNGCGVKAEKMDGHNEKETLVFKDGFAFAGVHSVVCQNAGCAYGTSNETLPIFVASGFSTNNTTGIAGGFTVDTALLGMYQTLNDKKISFGIIIANPTHIADSFLDSDKKVNLLADKKGALQVDVSATEYKNLSYAVNGCANYEDLELIVCMYAYTDGEVQFIQSATSNCYLNSVEKTDATLKTVSYKSVVAVASQTDAILPTKDN